MTAAGSDLFFLRDKLHVSINYPSRTLKRNDAHELWGTFAHRMEKYHRTLWYFKGSPGVDGDMNDGWIPF